MEFLNESHEFCKYEMYPQKRFVVSEIVKNMV